MIPIPKTQHELLDGPKSNASLYFARMTECEENGKIAQNAIAKLGERLNSRFPTVNTPLAAIHARQAGFLGTVAQHAERADSGLALEIRARLTAPFVSGLGSGHPTETGLILDRNSGLPYIPASSIKGVLRMACALHIAETEPDAVETGNKGPEIPDNHPLLRRYFGDTDTGKADGVRGQLVFLDAFPAKTSDSLLKLDIMNPHFGEYYSGKQGPLEIENPIPVKFLAVKPGTEFVFRCFALPLPERKQDDREDVVFRPFGKTDEETVIALFKRAFFDLGFGGKTAIGYGRFAEQEIKRTFALKDDFEAEQAQQQMEKERKADEEAKRQREEEERKAREEDERLHPWKPWLQELDGVKDWDKLKALVFDTPGAETWRGEDDVAQTVEALCKKVRESRRKDWTAEQDAICAAWLQPAGITWEPLPELERLIWTLTDYGHYKSKNIDLAVLTLPEALALQSRFKDWKCNDKRARGDKKDHWQNLQARIRELKH